MNQCIMDDRTNRTDYRVSREITSPGLHAKGSVSDLYAYYAHRYSNTTGQKGKPSQGEESGDVLVVFIEGYGTENEEKGREGQSNRVQKIDTVEVVAVANWCS